MPSKKIIIIICNKNGPQVCFDGGVAYIREKSAYKIMLSVCLFVQVERGGHPGLSDELLH